MSYRRTMLVLSVVGAATLHGALFFAAPHIYLLKANSAMRDISDTFQVRLQDDAPQMHLDRPALDDGLPRPETIEDLLKRDSEMLIPEGLQTETLDTPEEAERIAEDSAERIHDLEYDPGVLSQLEAEILAIGAADARQDLDVPRRLARSGEPVAPLSGATPTLRGEPRSGLPGGGFGILPSETSFGRTGSRSGSTTANEQENQTGERRPAFEEEAFEDAFDAPTLPGLDLEEVLGPGPARMALRDERSYEALDDLVDIGVSTYIDRATGEGYFRLQVSPKSNDSIALTAKEVTFILDASSSIGQRKLSAATKGIQECLRQLRWEDRFNVVIFRDRPIYFRDTLVEASPDNIADAVEFVRGLEARGSTDVYAAMQGVVLRPSGMGVSDYVMLVSDGRPSKGSLEGRDLINALTEDNVHRRAIYTVGAGKSANRYLLDLLAYRNKGEAYVSPRLDTLDEDLPRFFSRIKEPVLVDLKADYGRIPRDQVFPREVPDFYRGRVVTVYGRFNPNRDREVVMRLSGSSGAREKELVVKTDLRAADSGDPSIAREWAFQKSYYLIGEICEVGETPELLGQLNHLSQTYGVRTSYTP